MASNLPQKHLALDFTDASLNRSQKELNVSFYFSPNLYGIAPGDLVELYGHVTDFYPGREPSQTPLYRIHIVSSVEHAERIRQQLETLMTEIEDVSRLEQSIADATNETLEDFDNLSPEDLNRVLKIRPPIKNSMQATFRNWLKKAWKRFEMPCAILRFPMK